MKKTQMDAAKAGEMTFDGKPCKNCGSTERYTLSGSCKACMRLAVLKNRQKFKKIRDEARRLKADLESKEA